MHFRWLSNENSKNEQILFLSASLTAWALAVLFLRNMVPLSNSFLFRSLATATSSTSFSIEELKKYTNLVSLHSRRLDFILLFVKRSLKVMPASVTFVTRRWEGQQIVENIPILGWLITQNKLRCPLIYHCFKWIWKVFGMKRGIIVKANRCLKMIRRFFSAISIFAVFR